MLTTIAASSILWRMSISLHDLKDLEYHGVRELAKAAEGYLRSAGTSQERGTVAEYPNERTVRYYITAGLLDSAIKRSGVTSVFGYEHLLTLLVIKKLQSDGVPIKVIKDLLADKSVDELEKLLGEEVHVFTKQSDLDSFRSSTGHKDASEVMFASLSELPASAAPLPAAASEPKRNKAKEYLESLLLARTRRTESIAPPSSLSTPAPLPSSVTSDWRRYEIVPGLELHIARRFRVPQDESFKKRILVLVDGILRARESRKK